MSTNIPSDPEYPLALLKEENAELKQRIKTLTQEDRDKAGLLEVLFDRAPFGIAIFDDKRNLLRLNSSAEDILDIERHAMTGCACDEIFQCYTQSYSCPGFKSPDEIHDQRTSTELNKKTLLRSVVQGKEGDLKLLIETFVDITAIDEANLAQLESFKVKNDFLSRMSHEMRTPMNAIMGFNHILLSERGSLTGSQVKMLQEMKAASDGLMFHIDNLLAVSDSKDLETRIENKQIDISVMMSDLEEQFKSAAEKRNNSLVISTGDDVVLIDPLRLHHILVNLLDNAIKFTKDGVIICNARVESDNTLVISITDTGEGISDEQQHVIFSMFEQSDGSMTRTYGGVGLGLTLAKSYAKLMGGRLSFKSKVGEGSTFTVRLPIRR